MFKQLPDNKIQLCCIGLLDHIAARSYRLQGTLLAFPELKDIVVERLLNYCPCCGEKLNPQNDGGFFTQKETKDEPNEDNPSS